MRILGIDPGSRRTGYGVIDRHGGRLLVVEQGCIALPERQSLAFRLAQLSHEVTSLLDRLRPDVAVLEALFRGVNDRSLIVLAQARGVLLANLALAGAEIHEFSPAEVKIAVTGHGRAAKEQVSRMVNLILGLGDKPLAADAADALAIAVCYAHRHRIDRLGMLSDPCRRAPKH